MPLRRHSFAPLDVADSSGSTDFTVFAETELHRAVKEGKKDEVFRLITQGESIKSTDSLGRTALHYAASRGSAEIVALLLENGADHSLQDSNGASAIHYVAKLENAPTFRQFVEAGADINAVDNEQQTPLHWAIKYGNSAMAESLIRAQAKVNLADKDEKTPFHYVAEYDMGTIAQNLIELQADVNVADKYRKVPLHYAAIWGSMEVIRLLIRAGAEIDSPDQDCKTPLHYAAAASGDGMVAQQLIESGANVNKVDKDKMTPLHCAVVNKRDVTAEILLKAQADVNASDKDRKTPLHYAVQYYLSITVSKLIEAGADVNAFDKDQKTPLHYAFAQRNNSVIPSLLEAGANTNATDKDSKTPLHYAATRGSGIVIRSLLKAWANTDATDKTTHSYAATDHGAERFQELAVADAGFLDDNKDDMTPREARIIQCLRDWRRGDYDRIMEAVDLLHGQLQAKIGITEEIIKAAAGSNMGHEVIRYLLELRGDKINITNEVVKAAAGNEGSGKEVMALLLEQRGGEVKITEEIMKAAAGNEGSGKEVMALLLEQRGGELNVTEEVMKAAAGNGESGKEVMALLLEQRGGEVKVTEEVVKAAVGNWSGGKEIMELLLNRRGDEVKITEEVVKATVGNWWGGKKVIELLLNRRGDEIKITEEIVKATAGTWEETEIKKLLLNRRGEEVQATSTTEISDDESAPASEIFSLPTILSSAATENSRLTHTEMKSATDELASIFLEDKELRPLYRVAVEDKRLGPERFLGNFRKLLKVLSIGLMEETRDSADLELANFISSNASLVATKILELVPVSTQAPSPDGTTEEPPEGLQVISAQNLFVPENEPISGRIRVEYLPSKGDINTSSDDEEPEEANNEQFVATIAQGRRFVEGSNAFKKLRRDFRNFVMSPSKQNAQSEPNIPSEAFTEVSSDPVPEPLLKLAQKIYREVLALLSRIGLKEKDIPPGHQRIWWMNRRGKRLYDDYVEHEPGALQALQEYLNTSAYRTRTTPEGSQVRTPSHSGLYDIPNRSSTGVRHSLDITDQARETIDGDSRNNYVEEDAEPGVDPNDTLHLLSCMENGRYKIKLHHDDLTNIYDDRELFRRLRRSYHEHRGRLRPYWSLRSIHSIHFMKFAYGGHRYIDARCHYDICELGKPCSCIPPADLVPPKGTEYKCEPIPSKMSPPIGERLMMDFFTDPDGIASDATFVLRQLPKRTYGELRSQPSEAIEAWGIYYKEGWDWVKICCVLGIGFFPPSLLFGILWGVLKRDVQGAFGVASWWMTGAAILVGITGTCTWKL